LQPGWPPARARERIAERIGVDPESASMFAAAATFFWVFGWRQIGAMRQPVIVAREAAARQRIRRL
jgi:hypothetical protein